MSFAVLEELKTFGPDRCESLSHEQALDYVRRLSVSQHPQARALAQLLPEHLQEDVGNVLAFRRWTQRLAREAARDPQRGDLLDWWRGELDRCFSGQPRHPVFVALSQSIQKHDLPREPFDDLIRGFEQDQATPRYDTFDALIEQCRLTANPVGRLVLAMLDQGDDPQRQRLADAACTAWQLTRYWRDQRRDIGEHGQVYLPADVAGQQRLDLSLLVKSLRIDCHQNGHDHGHGESCACTGGGPNTGLRVTLPAYRQTMRVLVQRTQQQFQEARDLLPLVPRDLRPALRLALSTGQATLGGIAHQGYDTITKRPTLSPAARAGLKLKTLKARLLG